MLVHVTHTAHSGDGDRTGDEAEAFIHTDIEVCCPGKEKEKHLSFRTVYAVEKQSSWCHMKPCIYLNTLQDLHPLILKYWCRAEKICVLHNQRLHH